MLLLKAAPSALDPSLSTLLLLATAATLGVIVLAALLARGGLRRRFLAAGAAIAGLYLVALLGVSMTSPARDVRRGDRLTFTGFYIDPHLHVAVKDVRWEPAIGPEAARGRFAIVTLEFSSDAARAVQKPYGLAIALEDAHGRRIERSAEGERALASLEGDPGPLEQEIEPGSSYPRPVVFDVPAGAKSPRLRVSQRFWVDEFLELWLIGDDESLGHRPARLELAAGG